MNASTALQDNELERLVRQECNRLAQRDAW